MSETKKSIKEVLIGCPLALVILILIFTVGQAIAGMGMLIATITLPFMLLYYFLVEAAAERKRKSNELHERQLKQFKAEAEQERKYNEMIEQMHATGQLPRNEREEQDAIDRKKREEAIEQVRIEEEKLEEARQEAIEQARREEKDDDPSK
tara:strand:+ start:300 stop:752 length:453 start_codon:yes stop_codon:yes gene_type:complete